MHIASVFFSLFFLLFQSSYGMFQRITKVASIVRYSLPSRKISLSQKEEAQKIIEETFAQLQHIQTKHALIRQELVTKTYEKWGSLIANNIERIMKEDLEKTRKSKERLLEIINNLPKEP